MLFILALIMQKMSHYNELIFLLHLNELGVLRLI